MTHERQKWWDSLPAEEKRVREDIKRLMDNVHYSKESVQLEKLQEPTKKLDFNNLIVSCQLKRIREHKRLIKALRKQIAMRPYVLKTTIGNFDKCPCCSVRLIKYFPHCACCGQKLRW